ncbi:hypothetical protein RB195_014842 [Necator americanus]|uniref:Endonuclease/exonuclease/phosphatase domain-containing protein n=1 Tax=Necator americanus TaxID=51031 RepID=A0ABR1E200_NECAM
MDRQYICEFSLKIEQDGSDMFDDTTGEYADIRETRWKGSKSMELGDGYKLIYHGISNRNDIGVILNETFRNSVTAVDRQSANGCKEVLEQYIQSQKGKKVLPIGGDFNGHVGSRKKRNRLQQHGLHLNVSKTEYMECGPTIEDASFRVDGTELNKVDCFKHHGSKVTSTGDIDQEGRARVNAWMKWKVATCVLCDKKVPVRLKSKIYRMAVRPVALYGCECWLTRKALERVFLWRCGC